MGALQATLFNADVLAHQRSAFEDNNQGIYSYRPEDRWMPLVKGKGLMTVAVNVFPPRRHPKTSAKLRRNPCGPEHGVELI